jgi:DNA (cytosine-5)-methyltransferase 1
VAQRRRRVFVVGYFGDWRVAAAVLFERESLQGNTKPSRKKREEVTANAEGSVGEAGQVVIDRAAFNQGENARFEPRIEIEETMSALVARGPHAVAQPIAFKIRGGCEGGGKGYLGQEEQAFTISTMQDQQIAQPIAVLHSMAIRRLTPKECERLQGFPDNWTALGIGDEPISDSQRYKTLGNAVTVNVIRDIFSKVIHTLL